MLRSSELGGSALADHAVVDEQSPVDRGDLFGSGGILQCEGYVHSLLGDELVRDDVHDLRGCGIHRVQDLELVSLALHLDHGIDDLVSLPDGVLGCDGFLDQVSGLHDGVHDVQSLRHVGGDER